MAAKKKSSSKSKSSAPAKAEKPVVTSVRHHVEVTAAPVAVAERVSETRDRSAVIALIAKLRDCDAEVARDAASTLAHIPTDAEAVDALSAVVINADGYFHSVVRAAAANTLGRLGDLRAVDALLIGINDTMAEASEEAVSALGNLRDARAISALEEVIRNDRGFFLENVRRTAEASLVRIK